MRPSDVVMLRKAVHELNGGIVNHSEVVLRRKVLLKHTDTKLSLHEEGAALALRVTDTDYPSGDADCIRANCKNGPELVLSG